MAQQPYQSVELELVSAGSDLSSALDAAQYGRVIRPDEPGNEAEARAITAFVDAFEATVEDWETRDARPLALARLSAKLEALEREGFHVHAGTGRVDVGECGGTPMPLPVAIVTITRSDLPSTTVLLPTDLGTAADDVTSH